MKQICDLKLYKNLSGNFDSYFYYKNRRVTKMKRYMAFCYVIEFPYPLKYIVRDQERSKYGTYCILFNERLVR